MKVGVFCKLVVLQKAICKLQVLLRRWLFYKLILLKVEVFQVGSFTSWRICKLVVVQVGSSGRPKLKFWPQFRPKLPVSAKFRFRPKPKKFRPKLFSIAALFLKQFSITKDKNSFSNIMIICLILLFDPF